MRERERGRGLYKFINSYESIQHVYPSNTNTYDINCNLKKIKNKNMGCNRDSMERPLVNIYKFWKFDDRFLVGLGFKFLELRCLLHVLLKHIMLLYLNKLIRKNKLLSLSTKT